MGTSRRGEEQSNPTALAVHGLEASTRPKGVGRASAARPRRHCLPARRSSEPCFTGPRPRAHMPGSRVNARRGGRHSPRRGSESGCSPARRTLAWSDAPQRVRNEFGAQFYRLAESRAGRRCSCVPVAGIPHRESPRRAVAWRGPLVQPRAPRVDRSRGAWRHRWRQCAHITVALLPRGWRDWCTVVIDRPSSPAQSAVPGPARPPNYPIVCTDSGSIS